MLGNVVPIDGTTNKSLNTPYNAFPLNVQQAIVGAAQSLGYDTSFIQNNTQVRAFLKNFADQWGSQPLIFGKFII